MKRAMVWVVLWVVLGACQDEDMQPEAVDMGSMQEEEDVGADEEAAPEVQMPALPATDASFVLGAAGAPRPTFGPDTAPDFARGYASLAEDGFNEFVPVFLVSESGEGTGHLPYYMPALPALGVPEAQSCEGPNSAWDGLPEGFTIAYPLYILLFDLSPYALWEGALVRERLQLFLDRCLEGDTSKLAASYLQDEPANALIATTYDDQEGTFVLDNVELLAQAGRDVLGKPTMMVEAPLPFVLEYFQVSEAELDLIIPQFWEAVDLLAPQADRYGFDVYPVDLVDDLGVVGEYVEHGLARAPEAEPLFVLQGSGYSDTGIPIGETGRRPTRAETRAMAMMAVSGGARLLYWYGPSATLLEDNSHWEDIREVVRDLRRSSGVFALPTLPLDLKAQGVEGRFYQGDQGVVWALLSNPKAVDVNLEIPVDGEVVIFNVFNEARVGRSAGVWRPILGPYQSGLFALVPVP